MGVFCHFVMKEQRMWPEEKQKQVDKQNNCRIKKESSATPNSGQRAKSISGYFTEKSIKRTHRVNYVLKMNCSERTPKRNITEFISLRSLVAVTLPLSISKIVAEVIHSSF